MKFKFLSLLLLLFSYGFSQEWHTNFENALFLAKKHDQKIIMVFQGSDWCAPCIKLDREIWRTSEFKNYASEYYVMVQVDFPRRKKNKLSKELQSQNNQLADAYNPQGYFPFVVIFNSNGEKIGETSYKKMSVEEYIQHLEAF